MPLRPPCTCYGRFVVCPACLIDAQGPSIETRGRQATTQAALLAALQPPGSWHTAHELAVAVERRQEQVHTTLNALRARGMVERQGARGRYIYTLTEEK